MYAALSENIIRGVNLPATVSFLADKYVLDEFTPKNDKESVEKAKKALADVTYKVKFIKEKIGEHLIIDITSKYLKDFLQIEFMPSLQSGLSKAEKKEAKAEDRDRSFNAYRSFLKTLFTYAESENLLKIGTNPVSPIRTQKEVARTRYVKDSELRRIKQALCRGEDGKRTRIGVMISSLIDLTYLTGQRQEDVRVLKWSDITAEGIQFMPSKTAEVTGERILIEMTQKLEEVLLRLKGISDDKKNIFKNDTGSPLSANNCTAAWKRAMDRCTLRGTLAPENRPMFRDLRRKALTDVASATDRGLIESQSMGAHANVKQTIDYINSPDIFITKRTKAVR